MRILIAVATCHARRAQADAQYHSWVQDGGDVRFFLGRGMSEDGNVRGEDVRDVILDVDDSYEGLPEKVKSIMGWATAREYDAVLKIDDDTYVVIDRLYRAGFENYDYVGNFRMRNGKYPADYASGFAYWLSAKAARIVAEAPLTDDTFEDRWVGNVLDVVRPRLRTLDEKRFACTYPTGIEEAAKLWGSPVGRTHIALAQYPAHKFPDLYYWHKRVFPENKFEPQFLKECWAKTIY